MAASDKATVNETRGKRKRGTTKHNRGLTNTKKFSVGGKGYKKGWYEKSKKVEVGP